MTTPVKTEKLYDTDAYCKSFSATVLSCDPVKGSGRYAVVLNRTAFFPEGGGQYADTGTLNDVPVLDVQMSDDGVITHYCDGALPPMTQVNGVLDWEQRYERMQNHTGEHLVSGTVHRLYGLDNIGFHLGERDVTCDFNGELSEEQLREVERVVNRAVWENVDVYAEYPDPATLPDLDYRSKLELTEDVRLVTIPGYDVCACCAPHVARTGEVGLIKIVNSEKAHGGTRIHMICGPWALEDYTVKQTNILRIVDLTSTPQEETADAVEALQRQNGHLTHELSVAQQHQANIALQFLKDQMEGETFHGAAPSGNLVVYLPSLETDALRALANGGRELCCGVFVALTDSSNGYRYIATAKKLPLSKLAREFNEALNGRGGGRDEMVQGSFGADLADIEEFFRQNTFPA
ncbi:MAG: hypothetical protein J6Y62_08460 [Clostridia bacterium]|nr:hypothetical protein [Clostridia bacterium]